MRFVMRFDAEMSILFTFLTCFSLVSAWPRARAVSLSPPTTDVSLTPMRPAAGAVSITNTQVDFASGSKVGMAAVDWDPTDDLALDGGTGCTTGGVQTVLAQDNSFMTLIFSNFMAEVGPYVRRRERAYCRVNVTLNSPGWAFDVNNIDFRGYLKLDPGARASIKTKYKFIGQHGRGKIKTKVYGPTSQDFIQHRSNDTQTQKTPRCVRQATTLQLTITMKVRTEDDDNISGIVKGDSADSRFKQYLNIGWKKCTDAEIAEGEKDNDHSDDYDTQEDKESSSNDEHEDDTT